MAPALGAVAGSVAEGSQVAGATGSRRWRSVRQPAANQSNGSRLRDGFMAGTALLRMINSQADALERMGQLDLAGPAAVLGQASRIVVVGTGTSQHAAELGAMMFAQAGRNACWYPAATWARWGPGLAGGDRNRCP